MALTNYPGGVSSFGIPVMGGGGIPAVLGNVWFVDYDKGSDDNDGKTKDSALKTIAYCVANKVTTNNHDVVLLSANSTHVLSSMLDISVNRTHFIGLDARAGFGMGARTKISLGVTTAATDIATMKNTGVGNTFTGIKFMNSNTVAEGIYCVAEGGEYSVYDHCEFYKSTDLDVTGASEVLNNGDSAQWLNCTFGSSADIVADNVIRPCMLVTATLSGKKCRDNIISDCVFLRKAGGTEARFIYGANATDVERLFLVKNTVFFNNPLSAATPAIAVDFGAAQTEGAVILDAGCSIVDVTVMGATGEGIYTLAPSSPTYATSGLSVAS